MRTIVIFLSLMLNPVTSWAEEVADVILPEEDKVFKEVMGPVAFADAYGNRETGYHGTFGRFPAGFETPVHIHSHAYRAIVLKGKMTNPFVGEDTAPIMSPGSFWSVAAETPHTTACVSEKPCEFFMYGTENFDFVPVE
ncbi:cupin domain-containing protein [Tateyamaria sp. SN3-11]|uniref:cupin domain-containing protein n=1 Tax=Tateyamaria sp. SN3-11 TaxID=3092147 RepID=UPI0039E9C3F9